MLQKFFKKILFILPFPLLVVSFNYWMDPANLFSAGRYERGIAELFLQKKNVANSIDCDERLMEKYYVSGLQERKEVLVVGSSRCMQIRASFFPECSFFNSSVSSARLEDYLALYSMYRQKGLLPNVIILGLDPWLLNRQNADKRWKSLKKEYLSILQILGLPDNGESKFTLTSVFPDRYRELFSISYFQESYALWLKKVRRAPFNGQYYATEDTVRDAPLRLYDGSYSYDRIFRSRTVEMTRKEVATAPPTARLFGFTKLDDDYQKCFEAFVHLLKQDGVHIIFFLPPYHPRGYDYLVSTEPYRIICEVEQYFRSIAQKNNILLIGSYNPALSALEESDFFDGFHPRESAVRKIFQQNKIYSCKEK